SLPRITQFVGAIVNVLQGKNTALLIPALVVSIKEPRLELSRRPIKVIYRGRIAGYLKELAVFHHGEIAEILSACQRIAFDPMQVQGYLPQLTEDDSAGLMVEFGQKKAEGLVGVERVNERNHAHEGRQVGSQFVLHVHGP